MIFPDELDNRPFRLFVQRTCQLINSNLKLSKIEKRLADLMYSFPELGFSGRKKVNVNERYDSDDINPFMILSALWQVQEQILNDTPKGVQRVIGEAFRTKVIDMEMLWTLAEIYLALYFRSRDNGQDMTEEEYLYQLQFILNSIEEMDLVEHEVSYPSSPSPQGLITGDMMQEMIAATSRSLHEEASTQDISVHSKVQAFLNKMPIEWVNAIATYWQRPEIRLKRDRVKDLSGFLQSDMAAERLRDILTEAEILALQTLLQNDGLIKYHLLANKVGDESEDSYWWTEQPPTSMIGRLRLKGIVAVGKAALDSRRYKIIIIPKDLRDMVAATLKTLNA